VLSEASAKLQWPQAQGAQSYRVEYVGDSPSSGYNMITVTSSAVTLSDLLPKTPYKYTVTALKPDGSSEVVSQGVFTTYMVCVCLTCFARGKTKRNED
jgi:hypothetical protein